MKLRRLDLIAFGPFEGTSLDLSAPGLHVVYGPNEAGKSTALRSIVGLLYGIPTRTGDAHRHDNRALRIGAIIEHGDAVIDVVRRKGNKDTLLDRDDEPTDPRPLDLALGGVPESLFTRMFGLDHRSLRHGAEAMLRGDGGVAESLFDAGGVAGIRQVLASLREEADAIFKPRGKNQRLNLALASVKELRAQIEQQATQPKSVTLQRETLDAAEGERAELIARRTELEAERTRLQRALRVQPRLSRRRDLLTKRAALGDVPPLPPDATERRLATLQALDAAEGDFKRIAATAAELTAARDAAEVDEALQAVPEATWDRLKDELGRHRSAMRDRPKREGELRGLERELASMQRDRGRSPLPLADIEQLRVDQVLAARVATLAQEHAGLEASWKNLQSDEPDLDEEPNEAAAGPDEETIAALTAALRTARAAGDLDARTSTAEATVARLKREVAALAEALEVEAETVRAWQVPSSDQLTTWHQRFAALEAEARDDARAVEAVADQRRQLEAELAELQSLGDVPTVEQLQAARGERDALLAELALRGLDEASMEALRAAIEAADQVADRLRAEAQRGARVARLSAEADRLRTQQGEASERAAERQTRRDELGAEMAAAWPEGAPALGERPAPAWLSWLERHGRLVELCEQRDEAAAEARAAAQARREMIARLRDAAGEPSSSEAALQAFIHHAEVRLEALRQARDRAERQAEARARRERERTRREAERARLTGEREAWQARWQAALVQLDLAAETTVAEAQAEVEARRGIMTTADKAQSLARRIDGMDRDAADFAAWVAELTEAHLADGDRSTEAAAQALLEAAQHNAEAARRRAEAQARLDKLDTERTEAESRRKAAEVELRALLRAAEVDDPAELRAVEDRVKAHRELTGQIEAQEASLADEGSLEDLEALVQDVDPDAARVELRRLDEESERIDGELRTIDQRIGSARRGLEIFESKDGAFGAAAALEERLAEIQELSERWAKLQLAEQILKQEVEAYRQRHQGPVVSRAGELFPRLTLGEYAGLRVDFGDDDAPELRCLGADGSNVGIDALSDGARDQLYLALRVASLERYADQAELLPVVADDILIHFDEDRARASLEVLHQLTARGQVLLFTHHARHVELAREAVPDGRLTVHELAAGHRRRPAPGRATNSAP